MFSRLRFYLIVIALATLVGGCAGGEQAIRSGFDMIMLLVPPEQTYRLTVEGMVMQSTELESNMFPESLKLNIVVSEIVDSEKLTHLYGGKLDSSDISSVKSAICESLRIAGLLNEDTGSARYQLTTAVSENKLSGFADITVTTHMQFSLRDLVTGEPLIHESVATPSTTLFSESHLYKIRIGKAMEGSVRGNIHFLLDRLQRVAVR